MIVCLDTNIISQLARYADFTVEMLASRGYREIVVEARYQLEHFSR
jgi:hypothetical protein